MSTTLAVAERHLTAAGLDWPHTVADLVAARNAILAATSSGGAHRRLVDQIDTDTVDVDQVAEQIRSAAAERVTGAAHAAIVQDLARRLEARILAELRSTASHEAVVAELRPLFDQAVTIYQEAAEHGVLDVNADELAKMGSAAIIAHARLADAYDIMQRVSLARGVTTRAMLDGEHCVALDSVQPSRKTGSFTHDWESCLVDAGSIPAVFAAGMTPRLNTNAEAAKVKARAEVPPSRMPSAAELAEDAREARRDAADNARHGTTAEQRAADRKAARAAARA